jgi:hypothetical protein
MFKMECKYNILNAIFINSPKTFHQNPYICNSQIHHTQITFFMKFTFSTTSFALLIFAFFALPNFLTAQKTLQQKLSADFCIELNKLKLSDEFSETNMQKIGLAMIPVITKYSEEIKKELGIELNDQEDYKKIGELIGQDAALTCPKFRVMTQNMLDNQLEKTDATETLEGTFVGLDNSGTLAVLRMKDASGREQKIFWMEYFEGSDTLIKTPELLKNKKVSITYIEREIYEPKIKDYVKVKVVTILKKM